MENPKIRFKGFTKDWEQRKLKEIADKVSEKNKNNEFSEPFTNSAEQGIISQKDYFDREIVNNENLDSYYIVRNDDFIYNPRISVTAPVGPINRNRLGRNGVMSPLYTVFRTHDIDNLYLEFYFKTTKWHRFMKLNGDSGARFDRFTISSTQFMEMPIPYPMLDEQRKMGEYFDSLDHLITLHQRKCEQTKKLKKYMLQKMFPQNGAKVPEIRFDGFTYDWEQRKLDDMCEIITKQTGFDYSATIKPSLVTESSNDTYSFIQNKDFSGNEINLDTDFYIPIEVAERFPKILLDKPSLLISISGRIGNVGFYDLPHKSFIGGAVGICKLRNSQYGEFIVQELESDYGQNYFHSLIKASSHANITVEDIRNINILMPKDDCEQEKIASYFSHLDHLITLHQRKCDELKKMKKYMLQNMFI